MMLIKSIRLYSCIPFYEKWATHIVKLKSQEFSASNPVKSKLDLIVYVKRREQLVFVVKSNLRIRAVELGLRISCFCLCNKAFQTATSCKTSIVIKINLVKSKALLKACLTYLWSKLCYLWPNLFREISRFASETLRWSTERHSYPSIRMHPHQSQQL